MFNQAKHKNTNNITCTVGTCAHHSTNNCCNAQNVKVGTEYAMDKAETFCSTFQRRNLGE